MFFLPAHIRQFDHRATSSQNLCELERTKAGKTGQNRTNVPTFRISLSNQQCIVNPVAVNENAILDNNCALIFRDALGGGGIAPDCVKLRAHETTGKRLFPASAHNKER